MKLNKASATSDNLTANGTLHYGGTLQLTNLSGTLTAGDSFQLFGSVNDGTFASILPAVPGKGLFWNTTA